MLTKNILEIAKLEFMVFPPMFIAATPVGASSRNGGLSGSSGPCMNVFVAVFMT